MNVGSLNFDSSSNFDEDSGTSFGGTEVGSDSENKPATETVNS
jgi:hypothetical protein